VKRPRPPAPTSAPPRRHHEPPSARELHSPSAASLVSLAALLVALLFSTVHMNTLVDTWISLAGGRQVLSHGVDDADPFSFNSRPPASRSLPGDATRWQRLKAWAYPSGWINQNWLSHAVLFIVYRIGGGGALLAWKILLYAAVAAVLLLAAHLRGATLAVSATVAAGALATSREYLEIRAQDHTNLVAALLMLVLALAARRNRRWWWSLPPLFGIWANLHGGFVFGFAVIVVFLTAGILAQRTSARLRRLPLTTIATGGAALAASVAATVVLSPYRLANLTHPIEISVGPDAALWRTVTEWQPLWHGAGVEMLPFLAFTIVLVLAMASAAAAAARGQRAVARKPAVQEQPLFDLADAAVVLFAVSMAVLSRRFVPLACVIAAAPLAQWLCEALARRRDRAPGGATNVRRRWAAALGGLAVVVAATGFGWRCVRTFAGPWPLDYAPSSVFDRLTYVHLRPTGVCRFLATNRITGRVWNLWEEGGYLAWCQDPGPGSGRVPVQVFIDGRAQGAYPADALRAYYLLRAGGPTGREASLEGRRMTGGELERARLWTRRELATAGVWLADVPYAQQDMVISFLLLNMESWQVVYADEEHTLLADTDTPGGRALSLGVESGTTRFPDDFSAALTRARRAVGGRAGAEPRRIVALARDVFAIHPSPRAVRLVAARSTEGVDRGAEVGFYREVVGEFFANRERHRGQNGYAKRLLAIEAALEVLVESARAGKDTGNAETLARQLADVSSDREKTLQLALW